MKKVLIVAHRGASAYEPENTVRAVESAIKLGADMVEVDVRLSKDGYVVVIHDETVDRTTDGSGYVEKISLKKLKKLDAGLGEKIPTLEEIVDVIRGKAKLVVEIKKLGMEKKVVKIFEDKKVVEDVLITSFYHETLRKIKDLNRKIKVGVIFRCYPLNVCQLALNVKAEAIFPEHKYVDFKMVEEAHRKGLSVYVWTVDDPKTAKKFVNMEVDGIVTNKPDILNPKFGRIKKVFLSGPIHGMEKKQFYREKLGKMLEAMGFKVLDPWKREKIFYSYTGKDWWENVPVKGFVKRDLEDIDQCDFLVAYLPKLSAGACMELFYAKTKGKPTYVICGIKNPSPWIIAHSTKIFRDFDELKNFLVKVQHHQKLETK